MLGSCVYQPLHKTLQPVSAVAQTIISFFALYNTLICIMFSSTIISMLTRQIEDGAIDLLDDLLRNKQY
jgi:hypothetical protein